jgi:hypothetical protein
MTFGGSGPIRGETTVNDKKTMSYDNLPCHLKTLTISNSILPVIFSNLILRVRVHSTFKNISVMLWLSVILVEDTKVGRENH